MTLAEMTHLMYKALENGDIHQARYYQDLRNAVFFDKEARKYDPAEFGGWNHGKS